MLKNIAELLPFLPEFLIPTLAVLGFVLLVVAGRGYWSVFRAHKRDRTPVSSARLAALVTMTVLGAIFLVLCSPQALTQEFYLVAAHTVLMAGIAWALLGLSFLGVTLFLFAIETEEDRHATKVFGAWTLVSLLFAVGTFGMSLYRFNEYVHLVA
ncbi:hypothetical protein VVR12_05515 [Rothia sp. LK2588]|uniref:hypothetical protein n=1 Tax=Rothia sp. LK2588 TaxID=3114369 RepID=UPI0034CE384F